MKTSIEKLLRALPSGSFYDIGPSDIGRRFCEFDNPALLAKALFKSMTSAAVA